LTKSAVAGGAGSALGGGKFADGAVTGSFTYLLNDTQNRFDARRIARALGIISELTNVIEMTDETRLMLRKELPKWARTIFQGVSANASGG